MGRSNSNLATVVAIKAGYDIVGIRWDCDGQDNLVIFEKDLSEQAYTAEDS